MCPASQALLPPTSSAHTSHLPPALHLRFEFGKLLETGPIVRTFRAGTQERTVGGADEELAELELPTGDDDLELTLTVGGCGSVACCTSIWCWCTGVEAEACDVTDRQTGDIVLFLCMRCVNRGSEPRSKR